MTLYTGINGVVKELTGLRSGVGGAVKTNSQMYGGVGGTKKRIFPKYTINDIAFISIEATSYYMKDITNKTHGGPTTQLNPSAYSYIGNYNSADNSRSASVYNTYETSGKKDYYWAVVSFNYIICQLYGTIYAVAKDNSKKLLADVLRNVNSFPGLVITSYDIPLRFNMWGNGYYYYGYQLGNRYQKDITPGTRLKLANTYSAADFNNNVAFSVDDLGGYLNWYLSTESNNDYWAGSGTGFGCAIGYEAATINGVSIPIRLESSIANLAAPTY